MKVFDGAAAKLALAALLLAIAYIWTGNSEPSDMAVLAGAALTVSFLFSNARRMPRITPRRAAWSAAYLLYLFAAIVKANLDVASRIVKPSIPLNPGIVAVKTGLTSPLGRTVLANSITLTPGTLSVDIRKDTIFVHWIDVKSIETELATEEIVAGFEKYLEVIFG